MAQCTAFTANGTPCAMPTRKESAHCISHDPAYALQQEDNRRAGALEANITRRLTPIAIRGIDLGDRVSLQYLLDALFRLQLSGQLTESRARNLIRTVTLALRNLDKPTTARHFEPRTPPTPEEADDQLEWRCALDTQMVEALEFARQEDKFRAMNDLATSAAHQLQKTSPATFSKLIAAAGLLPNSPTSHPENTELFPHQSNE